MPTSSESLYAHNHTQITISYHPLHPHILSNPLHIHMRLTWFWPALTPICFISSSPCFKSYRPTPNSRPPPINPLWTKCQWSATWKCMKGRPHWIPQLNSDRERELHHSPRPASLMKCTVRRACSVPQRWSRQIKSWKMVADWGMKSVVSDGIFHKVTHKTSQLDSGSQENSPPLM